MRVLALAVFGLASVNVCGCASPPPRLAQLTLSVSGDGSASVLRSIDDPSCDGGICAGGLGSAGSTTMAYEPGTDVTLTARPSTGWQFTGWTITIYGQKGAADHGYLMTASTHLMLVVHDTGQQMSAFARFESDANDAGVVQGAGD